MSPWPVAPTNLSPNGIPYHHRAYSDPGRGVFHKAVTPRVTLVDMVLGNGCGRVEPPARGPLRRSQPAQGPRPAARSADDLPIAAIAVLAGARLYATIELRASCAEQAMDPVRADTTLHFQPGPVRVRARGENIGTRPQGTGPRARWPAGAHAARAQRRPWPHPRCTPTHRGFAYRRAHVLDAPPPRGHRRIQHM